MRSPTLTPETDIKKNKQKGITAAYLVRKLPFPYKKVRLIHLSDLHIPESIESDNQSNISGCETSDPDALEQLEHTAKYSEPSSVYDMTHCLVSGDISATGKKNGLLAALGFLQNGIKFKSREHLVGLGYLKEQGLLSNVPGNHDIWGGQSPVMAWYMPNRKKQDALEIIGKNYPRNWKTSFMTDSYYIDVGQFRIRTYLLNSTFPGLNNLFAKGRVPQKQLDDLDEMVEDDAAQDRTDTKKCLRIAVLHHPIHSISGHWYTRYKMLLENPNFVCRSLIKRGFGVVLCGHEHIYNISELYAKNKLVQCLSGSATQTTKSGGSNAFYIYEITDVGTKDNPDCLITPVLYERSGKKGEEFKKIDCKPPFHPVLAIP